MNDKNKLALALLSAVALQGCATAGQSSSQTAAQPEAQPKKEVTKSAKTKYEKCYGIAKAGENGCASNGLSCSGHATSDRQANAWILVPQGLCNKIAGGRKG